MNFHVISLARTPERLDRFLRMNPDLPGLTICEAVDGRTWQPSSPEEQRALLADDHPYSLAAMGCAFSHRALWLRCMALGQPLTICEDDALLHRQFKNLSKDFMKRIPADWDVVIWGWNFDSGLLFKTQPDIGLTYMKFDPPAMIRNQAVYRTTPIEPTTLRVHMAFGNCCYSVSPAGAEKLLKACFPIRPFDLGIKPINRRVKNRGVDVAMNAHYPNMQVWAPFPPLALTENDQSISTIQTKADKVSGS